MHWHSVSFSSKVAICRHRHFVQNAHRPNFGLQSTSAKILKVDINEFSASDEADGNVPGRLATLIRRVQEHRHTRYTGQKCSHYTVFLYFYSRAQATLDPNSIFFPPETIDTPVHFFKYIYFGFWQSWIISIILLYVSDLRSSKPNSPRQTMRLLKATILKQAQKDQFKMSLDQYI